MQRLAAILVVMVTACGGNKDAPPAPTATVAEVKPVAKTPPPLEAPDPVPVDNAVPPPPGTPPMVPEGNPPPDGKYERVIVDGITVPMVNVMEGGTVVLVDTDGKKPRTWEEQYKRKKLTAKGQFDVHKTDANKNGKFDDDAIDKEGLWVIDDKGNLTRH
jgi:type IV secretory pathway VirB10-like protein